MNIESINVDNDAEDQKRIEDERLLLNPGCKVTGDELDFIKDVNLQIDLDMRIEIKQYNDQHSSKKGLIDLEDKVRETVKVEKTDDDHFVGSQCMGIRDKQLDTELTSIEYIKNNTNDYYVCAKSDGVRYLMYVFSDGKIYMGGRNLEFFRVPIYFPSFMMSTLTKADESDENSTEKKSKPELVYLFDGELVISESKRKGSKKSEIQYLFFDAIYYQKKSLVNNPYSVRVGYLRGFECDCKYYEKFFAKNRDVFLDRLKNGFYDYLEPNKEPTSPSDNEANNDGMNIEKITPIQTFTRHQRRKEIMSYVKDFFMAYEIDFQLNKVIDTKLLPHDNDGQIFTKIKYPYLPGKSKGILKWKPKEINTVDFLISYNEDFEELQEGTQVQGEEFNIFDLYCVSGRNIYLFDYLFVFSETEFIKIAKEFKTYHFENTGEDGIEGIIAECKYNEHQPVQLRKQEIEEQKPESDEYENDDKFKQTLMENENFYANLPSAKTDTEKDQKNGDKADDDIKYEPTKIDAFYNEFDYTESEAFDVIWELQQPKVPETEQENERVNRKLKDLRDTFFNNLNQRLLKAKDGCKQGNWTVFRMRYDKLYPNNFMTAKNIVDEIFNQGLAKEDMIKKLCKTKNN